MELNHEFYLNSNVGINGVTRTDETLRAYLNRGLQMTLCAAEELNIKVSEIKPSIFIQWLEARLPKLKPSSRRQYIASTRFMLEHMSNRSKDQIEKQELMSALTYAKAMKSEQYSPEEPLKKKWRGATSSQKSKSFSDEEYVNFVNEVKKVKWKWAISAAVWIAANRLVGLRPSEWRHAVLHEESRAILEVGNGKHSNGRANGKTRHLDITDFKKEELALIKRQFEEVKGHAGSNALWNKYYAGVRQAIYKIVRRLGNQKKYPTLYSSRHQFAADAKSSGMSLFDIAALMGHATDETATMHYGKKKIGRGSCRVKPEVNEVATVRSKVNKILHKSNNP